MVWLGELFDEFAGAEWGEKCFAGLDGSDCGDELIAGAVLSRKPDAPARKASITYSSRISGGKSTLKSQPPARLCLQRTRSR